MEPYEPIGVFKTSVFVFPGHASTLPLGQDVDRCTGNYYFRVMPTSIVFYDLK